MANYIRTLVSGDKSRHKDRELDVDLDLAYITDRVIVMGYPASGVEGLYRNRREDAKRFLEHRHGTDYWVFNFCPVRENSYPASFFGGRVSRYPFPDHHAPPLAILALAAREMRSWLDGSPKRVAVLHCKAGKGRSGTMACAYLLSRDTASHKPVPERQMSVQEWAEARADELMNAMPEDVDAPRVDSETSPDKNVAPITTEPTQVLDSENHVLSPRSMSVVSDNSDSDIANRQNGKAPSTETTSRNSSVLALSEPPSILKDVLDLHTSRRMRTESGKSSTGEKKAGKVVKQKQGVSIPSQRRWLLYWSLLLSGASPPGFWGLSGLNGDAASAVESHPKARITSIQVRMREPRGVVASLAYAINTVAHQTGRGNRHAPKSKGGEAWISLARYDDKFVEALERWERHTRSEDGRLGVRAKDSEELGGERLAEMFESGKWDKDKMVRSFARMGAVTPESVQKSEDTKHGKIVTYTMSPLSDATWTGFKKDLENEAEGNKEIPAGLRSETTSVEDLTTQSVPQADEGILIDANREFRGKLYMGQVFYGWFWLIPSFHLPPYTDTSSPLSTKVVLGRKEVDFPLGLGEALIDVELDFEWAIGTKSEPARQGSEGSTGGSTSVIANVRAGI